MSDSNSAPDRFCQLHHRAEVSVQFQIGIYALGGSPFRQQRKNKISRGRISASRSPDERWRGNKGVTLKCGTELRTAESCPGLRIRVHAAHRSVPSGVVGGIPALRCDPHEV